MPRLSREQIDSKEASKKAKRSSRSKDDERQQKTSSIAENHGESSQRKSSDARKPADVVPKKVENKGDKKSRKVKEDLGSGREEGELESSEEDGDEDEREGDYDEKGMYGSVFFWGRVTTKRKRAMTMVVNCQHLKMILLPTKLMTLTCNSEVTK